MKGVEYYCATCGADTDGTLTYDGFAFCSDGCLEAYRDEAERTATSQ